VEVHVEDGLARHGPVIPADVVAIGVVFGIRLPLRPLQEVERSRPLGLGEVEDRFAVLLRDDDVRADEYGLRLLDEPTGGVLQRDALAVGLRQVAKRALPFREQRCYLKPWGRPLAKNRNGTFVTQASRAHPDRAQNRNAEMPKASPKAFV